MKPSDRNPPFEVLLDHLHRSRGFDFSGYKRSSLMRRVKKRMEMVSMESFTDYVDYLEVHPEEFTHLFNTILINVTSFFRDAPAWDYLSSEIVPRIIANKKPGAPIRVWSAGCASGEEAYTLAMVLCESLGTEQFRDRVKIYATDVDEEALMQARQASYSAKDVQDIPEPLRNKYFELVANRYVFRNDLRRSVIFGRHDLVQDAPISRLDLLVSRNTLMYLNSETQGRILARFHFALDDGGYLFLGKAEMLLTHANLFTPVNLKYRIFAKVGGVNLRDRLLVMAQAGYDEGGNHLARQVRIREAAFDSSPVAAAVVDVNGVLVLANEQMRTMFNLSLKDLGHPLQDLELSYRPIELRSLIEQAYAERRAVAMSDIKRHLPNGEVQYLDLHVSPLQANGNALLGASIVFDDMTQSHNLQEELRRSNQELETAYEELQSANEELETTNEELQSANEELETTNEELQSANEELETMNEELQSSNEELQTVNEELRQRTDEFNQINNWLEFILASLPVGLVVVDRDLQVLMWNQRSEDLWGLHADEVQGHPFLNLDIGLPVGQLAAPIRACLAGESLSPMVLDATNRRGRAIKCEVTCSLFVNPSNNELGVAVMMEDVTDRLRSQIALQESEQRLRSALHHLPVMLAAFDENSVVVFWNKECERVTGYSAEEIVANPNAQKILYPDDEYRERMLADQRRRSNNYRDWEWDVTCKEGKVKTIAWSNVTQQVSIPGWAEWAIGMEVTRRK